MGADFLEKAAPSFQKCWDQGRLELVRQDLLARLPTPKSRSFVAELKQAGSMKKGDRITVESVGGVLLATVGDVELARCENSPAELLDAVQINHGMMQGIVEELHEAAGVAEISICLAP